MGLWGQTNNSCWESQSYWKWPLRDHGTGWSGGKTELFLCVPRLTSITNGSTAARWIFSFLLSLMSLLPLVKPPLRLFGFLVIKMTTCRCLSLTHSFQSLKKLQRMISWNVCVAVLPAGRDLISEKLFYSLMKPKSWLLSWSAYLQMTDFWLDRRGWQTFRSKGVSLKFLSNSTRLFYSEILFF